MPNLDTKRPYQERFLDNYERSELRREVEAVKPRRFHHLKRKYATWALGASLALGGIGAPLKILQRSGPAGTAEGARTKAAAAETLDNNTLVDDLRAAESIAKQVASGVETGVKDVAKAPLKVVTEAPKQLALVTDQVRQEYFQKEVPFGTIIYREAKKNDLRPELVAAVVQAESKFKPTARSGAGAVGLMQLVPRTGRWMGARDLTNPTQNIEAGTKYLKYLHDRFDGNETKVIAAYNAGEGNVKRFGGVPPFRETRQYVNKVRNFEQEYHNRVENRVADMATGLTQGVAVAELAR